MACQLNCIDSFYLTGLLYKQPLVKHQQSYSSTVVCGPRWTLYGQKYDNEYNVHQQKRAQKENHDGRVDLRHFNEGDKVLIKNFGQGAKWKLGTIHRRNGPLSYQVQYEDGVVARRHVDHLLERREQRPIQSSIDEDTDEGPTPAKDNMCNRHRKSNS